MLKGVDALYDSSSAASRAVEAAFADTKRAREYVQLLGDELSTREMAALFFAADAYVSASMAEAFQIPLAEATAAGLPVIAPAGGATEEVVDPISAVLVPSVVVPRARRQPSSLIRVDVELLSHAMQSVVTNTSRPAHSARKRGPMWASRMLSIEYSADMVLAEVDRRRA